MGKTEFGIPVTARLASQIRSEPMEERGIPRGDVPVAVETLGNALACLEKAVTELVGRIQPVVKPAVRALAEDPEDESKKEDNLSPVAEALVSFRSRVGTMIRRIDRITEEIQL